MIARLMRNHSRKFRWLPVAAVIATLAAGCDGSSPSAPTLPEGDVPWVVLAEETNSDVKTFRRQEVRTQEALEVLWEELETETELPTVNFDFDMVLAVGSGEQPNACYSIEVTAASADGTDLTVTVTEDTPSPTCGCAEVLVQPVEVIRVPRANQVFFLNLTSETCAS